MKTRQTVLSLVTIICLLLANFSTVLAGGPPGLPSSFYGTALVDGVAVPEDTVITAWINGVQYGNGLVKLVEGQLGYSLDVLADDASTPEKEGGVSGDTVVFKIGGMTAVETGIWNVGNAQLNLTAWNDYSLTITSEHGTVGRNPDQSTYNVGDEVTLQATPVSGWKFDSWSGDITSTDNPVDVTITGNMSITANYTEDSVVCYDLDLGHGGNGTDPTANPTNSTGCTTGQYIEGETIALSGASPASGWKISGWVGTVDNTSKADNNTVIMPAGNHVAGVVYTEVPTGCNLLTVSHSGNGSDPTASPTNSMGCPLGYYNAGERITMIAAPEPGWEVEAWTGTDTASSNLLYMPDSAHAVGVAYVQSYYTITITPIGNGTVVIDPPGPFRYGDFTTATAVPAEGWRFVEWGGDIQGTKNPESGHVVFNIVATALFTEMCYPLTLSHTGLGLNPTASPTSSTECSEGWYVPGEIITLTPTPADHWELDSWTGTDGAASNILTMPEAAHTVEANYTQIKYTLTVDVNGSGSITVDPEQPFYYYGDLVTLTAIPAVGWQFEFWSGDSSGIENPKTGMTTKSATIIANFSQNCYPLTLAYTGTGILPDADKQQSTGCGPGYFHAGENITLTPNPAPGWNVGKWNGTNAIDSPVVTMPAAAHVASVDYTQGQYALGISVVGSGTVEADPQQPLYDLNDVVQLTANPATGWQFSGWSGDLVSTVNPDSVTIVDITTVTATFIRACYPLTIELSDNGAEPVAAPANSAGCDAGSYVMGEVITLSGALPDSGWHIGGWLGSDDDASMADSNTVTMPAAAHTASVMYEEVIDTSQPTVTINQGAGQADPASAVPVVFDVLFSEDVTGFESADVTITGTAKGTKVVTVSGSGAAYTVEVKGITSSGSLIANIAAGAAQDGAANLSQASTSIDNSVTFAMPAAAGKPKLLQPGSAVIIGSLKPAFDWTDSLPAAMYYQIQVGTSSRFTAASLVIDQNNIVESNYTAGADLLPGMRYYWRVRGYNGAEVAGAWSSARSFRTPLEAANLVTVGAGEELKTDRPDFNWDNVAGATKYRLQISKNNLFRGLVLNKVVSTSELTPPSDLPVNSHLYWRVRAESAYVTGPWSEVRDFTTVNPPSVPVLVSPKNKALTTNYLPKLDWKNSSVPAGTVFDHYQVQVSAQADFSVLLVDEEIDPGVANSEYTLEDELTPNTVYYWRVRAFNEKSEYSGWSTVWTLRAAMLAPVLSAPENGGAPLLTDRPEFDWEDRAGASGYIIQVSKVATFKSVVLNKKTTTSAYVPTSDLPADSVLYWRVQASGPNGPSLWSEVWSFTTGNPPSVPSLVSPANKALTKNYSPKFDWGNSSAPAGTVFSYYRIQVSTDPAFGTTVINDTADISEFTPILVLDPNSTFYWRVCAYNTDGEVSGWSAVRTVRTAIAPPVLSSPVSGAAAGSLKPVFDWEDAAGATSYTIQVSKVASFSSVVLSKTAAGSTYTPTTNLPAGQTLYWRVQAKGPNGPSAWSVVESFVTP